MPQLGGRGGGEGEAGFQALCVTGREIRGGGGLGGERTATKAAKAADRRKQRTAGHTHSGVCWWLLQEPWAA